MPRRCGRTGSWRSDASPARLPACGRQISFAATCQMPFGFASFLQQSGRPIGPVEQFIPDNALHGRLLLQKPEDILQIAPQQRGRFAQLDRRRHRQHDDQRQSELRPLFEQPVEFEQVARQGDRPTSLAQFISSAKPETPRPDRTMMSANCNGDKSAVERPRYSPHGCLIADQGRCLGVALAQRFEGRQRQSKTLFLAQMQFTIARSCRPSHTRR